MKTANSNSMSIPISKVVLKPGYLSKPEWKSKAKTFSSSQNHIHYGIWSSLFTPSTE